MIFLGMLYEGAVLMTATSFVFTALVSCLASDFLSVFGSVDGWLFACWLWAIRRPSARLKAQNGMTVFITAQNLP